MAERDRPLQHPQRQPHRHRRLRERDERPGYQGWWRGRKLLVDLRRLLESERYHLLPKQERLGRIV